MVNARRFLSVLLCAGFLTSVSGLAAIPKDCSDDAKELAKDVSRLFKKLPRQAGNFGAWCGAAHFNDPAGAKKVDAGVFSGAKATLEGRGFTFQDSRSGDVSYHKTNKKGAQLIYHASPPPK